MRSRTRIALPSFGDLVAPANFLMLSGLVHRSPKSPARLAELSCVMQLDFSTGVLLGRINDAAIEGARIHMQADCPLIELARIVDTVHGFDGIDRTGMSGVHLDGIRRLQIASAFLELLGYDAIVFDQQSAHRDSHPAVLVAVVVDRAALANFPTDRNQFV